MLMEVKTIKDAELDFNGISIQARGQMMNLTAMWKACNGKDSQRPANWAQYEGAAFINFIAENVGRAYILDTRRGRNGGTWAHYQIGLAYAKYLSHEFHAWCNDEIMGLVVVTPEGTPQVVNVEAKSPVEIDFNNHRVMMVMGQMLTAYGEHMGKMEGVRSDVAEIRATVKTLEDRIEDALNPTMRVVQPEDRLPEGIDLNKSSGVVRYINATLDLHGAHGDRQRGYLCRIVQNKVAHQHGLRITKEEKKRLGVKSNTAFLVHHGYGPEYCEAMKAECPSNTKERAYIGRA